MNTYLNFWETVIVSFVLLLLWFLTADLTLTRRYSRRTTVFCVLVILFLYPLAALLPVASLARILLGFLIVPVPVQFLYRDKWYEKLLVSLLIVLSMVFSELLCVLLLPKGLLAEDIPMKVQISIELLYLFINAMLLTAIVMTARVMRKRQADPFALRQTLLFLLFPISQYLSYLGWFYPYTIGYSLAYPNILPFALALSILADIALLAALNLAARSRELRVRNELLEVQMTAQKEYYGALAEHYEDVRRMRHDIDNHLYTIKSLLDDGQVSTASRYAQELYQARAAAPTLAGCANPAAASYLLHRQKELAEQAIPLHCHLLLPSDLPISDTDLICALGNLLDNAAEACAPLSERTIRLRAVYTAPYLSIEVRNPQSPSGQKKARRIPELPRGIGFSILGRLAERYDGDLRHGAEDGEFVVSLILKLG